MKTLTLYYTLPACSKFGVGRIGTSLSRIGPVVSYVMLKFHVDWSVELETRRFKVVSPLHRPVVTTGPSTTYLTPTAKSYTSNIHRQVAKFRRFRHRPRLNSTRHHVSIRTKSPSKNTHKKSQPCQSVVVLQAIRLYTTWVFD
jgi:hypothetical protein